MISHQQLNTISMNDKGVDLEGVNPKFKDPNKSRIVIGLLLTLLALVAVSVALVVLVIRDKDNDDNGSLPQVAAQQHSNVKPTTPIPHPATATATPKVASQQHSNVKPTTPIPHPATATATPKADDICMTDDCVRAAAILLDSIDATADPCENFYQYACGGWVKSNVIPEDKSSTGVFGIVGDDVDIILKYILEKEIEPEDIDAVKKAKNLLRSCEDLEEIEKSSMKKAREWLGSFGGWPVLDSKEGGRWNVSAFDFTKVMINFRRYSNSAPIMDSYVYDDSKDPTKNILYVDQPSLGMPNRDYLLQSKYDTERQAYIKYASDVAIVFGAKKDDAEQQMKEIVDFETKLANLSMPDDERRDAEKLYNKMTIAELKKNSTKFDWIQYFNGILGIDGVKLTVDETEALIVTNPVYINEVFNIIQNTPKKVIANYLCWRAIMWMVGSLPESVRAAHLEYRKVLVGSGIEAPRWKTCASQVNSDLGLALGKLFVEEAFNVDARDNVKNMIENLRASMKELLQSNEWMDEQTKVAAKEKADAIDPRIGFPDNILNNTFLNDRYANYKINENDYFGNNKNLMIVGTVENLKKLRKPVDRDTWEMAPATVNAYYNPPRNQIMFPAGILQPPFFKKSYPQYLNYGGIGYVIGHEITHGFDDEGREYDKNGNLHQWWTKESIDKFKVRAQCLIDQYGSYVVTEANMTLNGELTLGENIADNGGLKESWSAYEAWIKNSNNGKPEPLLPGLNYTQQQMFYLNAGHVWCGLMRPQEAKRRILTDPHSNFRFRVIGPLQNNDGFSKAFNCAKGTYMNPEHKCLVW